MIIIIILNLLSLLVIFYFYLKYFYPLQNYKLDENINNDRPVSIIICSRNQSYFLKRNLPYILKQNCKELEIIIVDDASTDDTKNFILQKSLDYPEIKYLEISEKNKEYLGKKFALMKGLEAASHDIVLLTDADCIPASDKWVQKMIAGLNDKNNVVLGYAPYESQISTLGNIIASETSMTALLYSSFAHAGKAYMGVGRNICYHKNKISKEAFEKIKNHISGDDDLLFQECFSKNEIAIQFHPDAHVYSIPAYNFKDWKNQKRRHLSVANKYPFNIKFSLFLFNFAIILLHISAFVLLFSFIFYQPYYIYFGCIMLGFAYYLDYYIQKKLKNFSFETKPRFENSFFRLFYYFLYLLSNSTFIFNKKNKHWIF